MLKRNVIANVLGGSWTALLSLLIIPVQIHVLGVEAYGLLAFMASVQILASIFDLGLSPTITREVTRDGTPELRWSRQLIRSVSAVYWPIGFVIGAALFVSADWIASHWLHLGRIPLSTGAAAIRLAAVALAIRWPVSFYSGVIAGRQRFDVLNALKAAVATVTLLGGIVIILVSRDLLIFMTWMVAAAAAEVTGYMILTRRIVPRLSLRPALSPGVRTVWRYATGMNAINVLAMVFTQSDRILISRLLSIQVLGYYALAYNILYGLSLIQNFVTSALFPAFVSSHAGGQVDVLRDRYQKASQMLLYVYNAAIWLLVFFGRDLLTLLTSASIAAQAFPILWVLALGFLLNASVALAYTACVATGNTGLPIRVNLVAMICYVPTLLVLTLNWGAVGAATTWLLLNLYYQVTLLPTVHKNVVRVSTRAWLASSVLPFVGTAVLVFGGIRVLLLATGVNEPVLGLLAGGVGVAAYAIVGFAFLRGSLKAEIASSVNDVRLTFGVSLGRRK
jgi:O-antigen/teichoic acid export membrane protein